jgi:hypothetical protein
MQNPVNPLKPTMSKLLCNWRSFSQCLDVEPLSGNRDQTLVVDLLQCESCVVLSEERAGLSVMFLGFCQVNTYLANILLCINSIIQYLTVYCVQCIHGRLQLSHLNCRRPDRRQVWAHYIFCAGLRFVVHWEHVDYYDFIWLMLAARFILW